MKGRTDMARSPKTSGAPSTQGATPKARAGNRKIAASEPLTTAVAKPASQTAPKAAPKTRSKDVAVVTGPDNAPARNAAATTGADGAVAPSKAVAFKRLDLIEAVCARAKIKRSDAKTIVELTLEEMGRALLDHGELVLPPLGKLSVKQRRPKTAGGETLILKLRPAGGTRANKNGSNPLAAARGDG